MLAVALGLSANASDQDLTGRASALVGLENKLREMTGKSKPEEAAAVIDGWREGHAANAAAQKELSEIRARAEADTYKALVKQGEESAQITPGNRAKVLERFTTSAALSAYLETAPAAFPGRANAGATAAHKGGSTATEQKDATTYKGKAYKDLSFSERAEWCNKDRDAWAAAKAEYDRQNGGA